MSDIAHMLITTTTTLLVTAFNKSIFWSNYRQYDCPKASFLEIMKKEFLQIR